MNVLNTQRLILILILILLSIWFFRFLRDNLRHNRKMKRYIAYEEWLKKMGKSENPEDRALCAEHASRIMFEGASGDMRGPWEKN